MTMTTESDYVMRKLTVFSKENLLVLMRMSSAHFFNWSISDFDLKKYDIRYDFLGYVITKYFRCLFVLSRNFVL